MTGKPKHKKDEISLKGEMIKNKLYNSADDVTGCDGNRDNTKTMMGFFLQQHISKRKPENK